MEKQNLNESRRHIIESNLRRIRSIVEKIDSRLEVKHGITVGENILLSEGLSTQRDDKIYIRSGEIVVASFPADEVFTENEVNAEVIKGLRKLSGEKAINL